MTISLRRRAAYAGVVLALASLAFSPVVPQADAAVRIEASAAQTQEGSTTSTAQEIADVSKLEPVKATDLEDGVYYISVDSSSSMFRIVDAKLTVEGGSMTCVVTMSGQGYGMLYMGTGEQAANADEKDLIPFVLDGDGAKTFEIPLESLNTEVACAAWSIKKEAWYDRTLVFLADSLVPVVTLADGSYEVAVTLGGGSGRATVESPAALEVEGGSMTLTLVWSSPNYDQMVVGETQYLPVNEGGNSTFEIPVSKFDVAVEVQAETTAMSTPHMIDYTLTLDSSSVKEAGN